MSNFNPRFHLDSEQDHHFAPERCTSCPYAAWAVVIAVFVGVFLWGRG